MCSLAIEQMKGFFKRSAGAGIYKIIGTPALVLPVYRRHPVRSISISRELQQEHISGSRQSTTDSSAQYRAGISAAARSPPETPPVPETPSGRRQVKATAGLCFKDFGRRRIYDLLSQCCPSALRTTNPRDGCNRSSCGSRPSGPGLLSPANHQSEAIRKSIDPGPVLADATSSKFA